MIVDQLWTDPTQTRERFAVNLVTLDKGCKGSEGWMHMGEATEGSQSSGCGTVRLEGGDGCSDVRVEASVVVG